MKEKPAAVAAFARASRAAKDILASDPTAWQIVRPLMAAEDDASFEALKRNFLAGIPRRPVAEERADAEKLYTVMARLGGARLVGKGDALPPDLYYTGRNG